MTRDRGAIRGCLPDGRGGEIVSVRMPGTKLIWAPTLGHFQLFDLVRDPGEREDRWGTGAPAAPLAHLLSDCRRPAPRAPAAPAPPPVPTPPPRPPTRAQPASPRAPQPTGYMDPGAGP